MQEASGRQTKGWLTHIECVITFPKVASTLSIGGPTKYKIKTGYDIIDDFILNTVCPNIVSLLPRQIALF